MWNYVFKLAPYFNCISFVVQFSLMQVKLMCLPIINYVTKFCKSDNSNDNNNKSWDLIAETPLTNHLDIYLVGWDDSQLWRTPGLVCWTAPGTGSCQRWQFHIPLRQTTRCQTWRWRSHPSDSLGTSSVLAAYLDIHYKKLTILAKYQQLHYFSINYTHTHTDTHTYTKQLNRFQMNYIHFWPYLCE